MVLLPVMVELALCQPHRSITGRGERLFGYLGMIYDAYATAFQATKCGTMPTSVLGGKLVCQACWLTAASWFIAMFSAGAMGEELVWLPNSGISLVLAIMAAA
jgi:hypothetical protein